MLLLCELGKVPFPPFKFMPSLKESAKVRKHDSD